VGVSEIVGAADVEEEELEAVEEVEVVVVAAAVVSGITVVDLEVDGLEVDGLEVDGLLYPCEEAAFFMVFSKVLAKVFTSSLVVFFFNVETTLPHLVALSKSKVNVEAGTADKSFKMSRIALGSVALPRAMVYSLTSDDARDIFVGDLDKKGRRALVTNGVRVLVCFLQVLRI
jgi:hypothetical protein